MTADRRPSSILRTGFDAGKAVLAAAMGRIGEKAAARCEGCQLLRSLLARGALPDLTMARAVSHDFADCPGAEAWLALLEVLALAAPQPPGDDPR